MSEDVQPYGSKTWGFLRVQVRGRDKWTTLAGGYWWGYGYDLTRAEAERQAIERRDALAKEHPDREYRVSSSTIE